MHKGTLPAFGLVPFNCFEVCFSAAETLEEPAVYVEYRDKWGVHLAKLGAGTEVPKVVRVNYMNGLFYQICEVTNVVIRVPQDISVLGARKRPVYELPFGQAQYKGNGWMSVPEMLNELYPQNITEQMGNEQTEKILRNALGSLREKIGEKYEIRGIDFGCEPTIDCIYKEKHELSEDVRESLLFMYGEMSKDTSVN